MLACRIGIARTNRVKRGSGHGGDRRTFRCVLDELLAVPIQVGHYFQLQSLVRSNRR